VKGRFARAYYGRQVTKLAVGRWPVAKSKKVFHHEYVGNITNLIAADDLAAGQVSPPIGQQSHRAKRGFAENRFLPESGRANPIGQKRTEQDILILTNTLLVTHICRLLTDHIRGSNPLCNHRKGWAKAKQTCF
jgi:hypothetical protein